MPPFSIPMPALANLKMTSFQRKVPLDWKQPVGNPDQDHYGKAFSITEHTAGAMVKSPPEVVGPATSNKYHGDAAKEVSKWYKDFMEDATDKIKSAVDSWRPKVKFKDVKVMALCGIGGPGILDAPDIKNEPSFSSWPSSAKEKNAKAYIKAVVEGFSKNWMEFSDNCTLPGLPWWPAFVAFTLAMAPPMPNIPMPLIALLSSKMTAITVYTQLSSSMQDALDSGVKDKDEAEDHKKIFDSIGFAVATNALAWLPMQMVMNVMGKGPVPPYAPPVVPLGPVVAGDVLPTPGHLT
jgi:hypothetical protein